MRLLVGIHLGVVLHKEDYDEVFVKFVRENFASKPRKTFFVLFEWPHFTGKDLVELAKKAKVPPENFLVVPCSSGLFGRRKWSKRFGPYKKGFARVLEGISKKLTAGEKVEVFCFGGTATDCYSRISHTISKVVRKKFGEKLVSIATVPRLVYGYRPSKKKSPKGMGGKRFLWCNGVLKILKRR